jgi:Zn ribbon nucleic-acid-binding protein
MTIPDDILEKVEKVYGTKCKEQLIILASKADDACDVSDLVDRAVEITYADQFQGFSDMAHLKMNTLAETTSKEVLLPSAQCPKCNSYDVWASTVKARTVTCHNCSHKYQEPVPVKENIEPLPDFVRNRIMSGVVVTC